MNPDQAESLIDGRTGAVLITHLHGETAGAYIFREICQRRGVRLIEDAAQAFGAAENGQRLGTIGDLGIYSFGFFKNVNAWRGGLLVSPDRALIDRIRRRMVALPCVTRRRLLTLAVLGLFTDVATWPPLFATVTYPLVRRSILRSDTSVLRRLDPESGARRIRALPSDYLRSMSGFQAALVLRQLDRVDEDAEARIAHARLYHEALFGLDAVLKPSQHHGRSHVYMYYPVQCQDRNALLHHAMRRGRDFAAQHLRNCADLPDFAEIHRHCPNARAAAGELILLPTYPRYPVEEIRKNIEVIQEFYLTYQDRVDSPYASTSRTTS